MRQRIYSLAFFALVSIGMAGTGCVKQSILSFDDHHKFPVTTLQVFVTKDYYVYKQHEHRFYMCTDAGDKLMCKRACGGSTDIACPSAIATGYGGTTNFR